MEPVKSESDKADARQIAREHLARGDALGWFDALYKSAGGDASQIPWADLTAHPRLAAWAPEGGGKALVVGCGLGDDAEFLSSKGWRVTAFDLSPEAIGWARKRHPRSEVDYQVANLLESPPAWAAAFDLVVEIYTLQALPPELREKATEQVAAFVAPRGTLFLYARRREEADDPGNIPWPLTRRQVLGFEKFGLVSKTLDAHVDEQGIPRFFAVFTRP